MLLPKSRVALCAEQRRASSLLHVTVAHCCAQLWISPATGVGAVGQALASPRGIQWEEHGLHSGARKARRVILEACGSIPCATSTHRGQERTGSDLEEPMLSVLLWGRVASSTQGTQWDTWMRGCEGGSHTPIPGQGPALLLPHVGAAGGCRLCCSLAAGLVSRHCCTQTNRQASRFPATPSWAQVPQKAPAALPAHGHAASLTPQAGLAAQRIPAAARRALTCKAALAPSPAHTQRPAGSNGA